MSAKNGLPCPKCGNNEWNPSGDCAPCARARVAKWQKENKEKKRANSRNWWRRHPEKKQPGQPSKERSEQRKERSKKGSRIWKRNNPDRVNATNQKRRAKKKGSSGKYTAAEWKSLCNQYGNKCLCCKRSDVKLTVDHVIPLNKGGKNTIDNIQPLCTKCNCSKGTKVIDYRERKISFWEQMTLIAQ